MKNNIKALQLVENGLSSKTVSSLTESQINALHSRLFKAQINEDVTTQTVNEPKVVTKITGGKGMATITKPGNVDVTTGPGNTVTLKQATEGEIGEDMNINLGNDPDATEDGMGIFEKEIGESKKSKKDSPFAICTSQLGKEFKTTKRSEWSPKQKDKYDRCVADLEKSLKEGKNPVSLFLENQIMKIVERNLPPRITKSDLIKHLVEASPAVAPEKPKTKPSTKPSPSEKPKIKPSHPGKNPFPRENPSPKATSHEEAKDKVIDVIMNLLQK